MPIASNYTNSSEERKRYIHLNDMYINIDLIVNHEPAETNPQHTKITFDAHVEGKPLVLEVDISDNELTTMIANAKDYNYGAAIQ
jgi:hypothetical protein